MRAAAQLLTAPAAFAACLALRASPTVHETIIILSDPDPDPGTVYKFYFTKCNTVIQQLFFKV